jgi:hypothetical protein
MLALPLDKLLATIAANRKAVVINLGGRIVALIATGDPKIPVTIPIGDPFHLCHRVSVHHTGDYTSNRAALGRK